jgi:hypothetical protein
MTVLYVTFSAPGATWSSICASQLETTDVGHTISVVRGASDEWIDGWWVAGGGWLGQHALASVWGARAVLRRHTPCLPGAPLGVARMPGVLGMQWVNRLHGYCIAPGCSE